MPNSQATTVTFAEPRSVSRWQAGGVLLLLIGLVLVVFGQCRGFEFVSYDDESFVTNNPHVLRGLTWENAKWALTAGMRRDEADIDFWRPLSVMSHMLDVSWFGLNAGAHHLVSVGLHALTVVALFLVLCSLTGKLWRTAVVAAVFAIHPLHVESVAWVAERKDVLCGLFFVLTLGAYARYARRPFHLGNYLLVLLLAALGLMSKPMLVTLPCVLLLLDYWPLRRVGAVPVMRLVLEKIPLFAMAAMVAYLTTLGPGGSSDEMMVELPLPWRAGNACVACVKYLQQMVWPAGLVCFYPHPGKSLALVSVVIALLVLMAMSVVVVRQRQKAYLMVGWLWYLGMLVPVIGILQSGIQAQADRYTYLPMIGVCVMLVWTLADWAGEQRLRRLALGVLAVPVLSLLTLAAFRQASHWRDSDSLWNHALACNPGNFLAHNNLGYTLFQRGETAEALAHYREALRIKPDYSNAHGNLGNALARIGSTDEALDHLRQAVEHEPDNATNLFNLGNTLLQTGSLEEAARWFLQAIAATPGFIPAHNNLGMIRHQQGRREEAIGYYQRVVALAPDSASAHSNLGLALLGVGGVAEAVRHYEAALQINADDVPALSNLAWVLATSSDTSFRDGGRALVLAGKARELSGVNHPEIMMSLAAALAETGNFNDAIEMAGQAMSLAATRGNESQVATILKQRARYLNNQPWRDEIIMADLPKIISPN